MLLLTLFASAACALLVSAKRHPCPHGLAIDITNGTILPNKTIIFNDLQYTKRDYYTVRNDTQTFGCICKLKKNQCVRKCCPNEETFKSNKCTPSSHKLATDPELIVHKFETEVSVPKEHFTILSSKFCKEGAYMLDPKNYPSDDYYIQENGSLYRPTGNGDKPSYHNPQHFCFEYFEDKNYSSVLVCFDEDSNDEDITTVYSIGMIISMPFLMLTFLIYACVPELQNLHGKCLMCYVITLFTAYVFLVSIQLTKDISMGYCVTAPFIVYFAFLVSFMWLNVMCIDIWWTFSGLRGFQGSARQSERKRFLIYSAYAWGVPLFMLALTCILQFVDMPNYIIKPSFGTTKCWFPDDKSVGYYFYGPILLVIISNMCLFTYTTFKIWTVHRDTDRSMGHDSQRHGDETEKQRYKLYLKLMLVFGVNWLMEIISWAVIAPNWVWYVTDMCNAMYGVFIFFIFVCKANVWKLVKKRYHIFMGRPYLAKTYATGSSTRSTGFSHSVPNGSSEMNDNSNM